MLDESHVLRPCANGLEVLHGTTGGVPTRSFLGRKEVVDGTELHVQAFNGEDAGKALAGLVVSIGWLG